MEINKYQDTAEQLLGICDDWSLSDIKEHLEWLINNPDEIAEGYHRDVFEHKNINIIMKYVSLIK